jgi:hypothetical protein
MAIEMRAAENLLQALEGRDPQDLDLALHEAVRLPASHIPVHR